MKKIIYLGNSDMTIGISGTYIVLAKLNTKFNIGDKLKKENRTIYTGEETKIYIDKKLWIELINKLDTIRNNFNEKDFKKNKIEINNDIIIVFTKKESIAVFKKQLFYIYNSLIN